MVKKMHIVTIVDGSAIFGVEVRTVIHGVVQRVVSPDGHEFIRRRRGAITLFPIPSSPRGQ